MRITALASSTLAGVAYDEVRKRLQLEFRRGAIYEYFDVPDSVHQALLHAPCKGHYFNRAIRGCFHYRRVALLHGAAPRVAAARQL